MQRKKLCLVDGNSYGYRAYYALPDLATSNGMATGAVYGFVTMLNKIRNEVIPDYFVVCFDVKGPTFRHEKFAEYKAHRKPMPDELKEQFKVIKNIVCAYGIPIFEMSGYEADDIIATLAAKFKEKLDVFIISNDKDMLQLVDKYVKIYNPQKDDPIIDEKAVFERYGVNPRQIADLLALAGDKSDNIPGVPGIGFKGAAELIMKFGSLKALLENADKIMQEKRKELLCRYKEQANLSRDLATVNKQVPLDIDITDLQAKGEDTETLRKLFQELEFKSLHRGLSGAQSKVEQIQKVKIERIKDKKDTGAFFARAKEKGVLALDIEFEKNYKITKLQFSVDEKCLCEFDPSEAFKTGNLKAEINRLFSDDKILKIGYDLKTACLVLAKSGIYLKEPFFDVYVAAYLLEQGAPKPTPEAIAYRYLKRDIDKSAAGCEYLKIKECLTKEIKNSGLEKLFYGVEMPLVYVLAAMEREGIQVDKKFLMSLGEETEKKQTELISKIYKLSGCRFNINSPKQLSEILFDQLKLPVLKKGKTGPSTDVEVLTRLAHKHELPALILEYREMTKLKSTYIDGMLPLIDSKTDKIHTSFNQAVTATGRLSSSSPNLQNIPIRTETGRQMRAVFTSRAQNWRLLCADYSQIELRVLAHLSLDERLVKAFTSDLDIHLFTAALIFHIQEDEVTQKMRDVAKRVNFGIIYGMGAYGLSRDIGIAPQEAKKFIEEYFKRYPQVKTYLDGQIKLAEEKGYVTTLLNRRRYIPDMESRNPSRRSFAERTAMNAPIQGTAADLIKVAMVDIYRKLQEKGLKAVMVLQVHDELVFDVPEKELDRVREIVKDTMENVIKLKVPIKVSLKTGKNWKDMK
ncbi:MAG: DNA polymerase I [Candidatus Omnitrophica bacterium]|nr:DNA polymerase I [Candidatus Omnitrophota bacterium]